MPAAGNDVSRANVSTMARMLRLGWWGPALAAAAAAAASLALSGAARPVGTPIRVTVLGDSVADSLQYVPSAERFLQRGFDVRFDLKVCRRVASPGCVFQGAAPPSALVAARREGRALGNVLVVDVGYNDDPRLYATGMDALVQAAQADGVKRIVWLTLRAARPVYGLTNTVIRDEAGKFPQLVTVADWNSWSAGKPWFGSDDLHLSGTGATALAQFLRPYLLAAADAIRAES
jgi:hypothetical protein